MNAATFPTITTRFAWKEYRMLRGFWLAVAGLTMFEQWLSVEFAAPGTNLPAWLLGSALFAAVLYAVGAAATSFAVEHEEETYHFLSGLPATWPAVLLGKLFTTTLSAIALAAVLALAGRALGGAWPMPSVAQQLVGLFGLAILEAVAWGTLCSLLLKRPLGAAMAALLATTISIHLAVGATDPPYAVGFELGHYNEAIPYRLALVAGVLLLCIALARGWLAIGTRSANGGDLLAGVGEALSRNSSRYAGDFATSQAATATGPPVSRMRTFSSLLWQTWRESWKLLFVPFLAACSIFAVVVLMQQLFHFTTDRSNSLIITTFALPALYGAMVFHADQRRRQYRFLVEHAASPRWVWLARHCVWGGAFVVVLLVALLGISIGVSSLRNSRVDLRFMLQGPRGDNTHIQTLAAQATATVLLLGLLPYAIGQLSSMLVRSGIIAIFLTLVLSTVATGWAVAVAAWDLSAWQFLVPLAVGLMAATWLRAPDWLAERNTWRGWWKPAAAIAVSIVLVGVMLPFERLSQLSAPISQLYQRTEVPLHELHIDRTEITSPGSYHEETATAEDGELVEQLYRALISHQTWVDKESNEVELRPKAEEEAHDRTWDLYNELWDKDQEKAQTLLAEANRRYFAYQKEEASKTGQMYLQAVDVLGDDKPRTAIGTLLAASRRRFCRFNFDWDQLQVPAQQIDRLLATPDRWPGLDSRYLELTKRAKALPRFALADEAVDYYIAALRMSGHLRKHVPTVVSILQLRVEQKILASFGHWALETERTEAELHVAAAKLEKFFQSNPLGQQESFAVDRQLIRDAIEGRRWPLALTGSPIDQKKFLAYHANQLPWERERALTSLDLVIAKNYFDKRELLEAANSQHRTWPMEHWLNPSYQGGWADLWNATQRAAATSYLMRYEFEARVPIYALFRQLIDTQTIRNATLLQIALARYRLARGEYPSQLSELKSDYLRHLPIDPYSGRDFDYRPLGLDMPLLAPLSVPADTPLFWSVGPNESVLDSRSRTVEATEADSRVSERPSDPLSTITERYYILQGLGYYYDDGLQLVFPLPRITTDDKPNAGP